MVKTLKHPTMASEQRSPHQTHLLSTCAHDAIATHFQTVIQHEAEVLADTDPEALHQMRVGMRRLRTTLQAYGIVLQLPAEAQEQPIKKLARILGEVRDLDVLIERLQKQYYSQLPQPEQKALNRVVRSLHKRRKPAFAAMKKALSGKRYRHFKSAYQDWLKQPYYSPLADYTIEQVLPDLLLPLVSQLMLHRGWLIGYDLHPETTAPERLSHWLNQDGMMLHSLRKQMKQVRYQTEFFTSFYSPAYKKQVKEFKAIQDLLGQLQDCWVLYQVLNDEISNQWPQQLPTLATLLQSDRQTLWKTWYPIRQRYLSAEARHQMRMLVAQPKVLGESEAAETANPQPQTEPESGSEPDSNLQPQEHQPQSSSKA